MFTAVWRFLQWVIRVVFVNRASGKRRPIETWAPAELLEERVLLSVTATWNSTTGQLSAYASTPDDPSVHIKITSVPTGTGGREVKVFDGAEEIDIVGGSVAPGAVKKIFTASTNVADTIDLRHVATDVYGFNGGGTGITSIELYGYEGNDKLYGSPDYANYISGSRGNDEIEGGKEHDTLVGGPGRDTLLGKNGNDLIWGQLEDDVNPADPENDADRIEGGAGNDTIHAGLGRYRTDTGDFDDDWDLELIRGDGGNDHIYGGIGKHEIHGGEGDDWIQGGTPPDSVLSGRDLINGDSGNDTIIGRGGDDVLKGGAGDDLINGGSDGDFIKGGVGADTIFGEGGDDDIDGDDGSDSLSGGTGNDNITGDSSFGGEEGSDTINGGENNDTLRGGRGIDIIYGENGEDSIEGGDANDLLDGGSDNDTVSGQDGDDFIQGGSGDDLLSGGDGADDIWSNMNLADADQPYNGTVPPTADPTYRDIFGTGDPADGDCDHEDGNPDSGCPLMKVISVTATDADAAEWDPATMMPDPGEFTISRAGDPTTSLTVTFSLSASTATIDADYSWLVDQSTGMPLLFNGTYYLLPFASGETTKVLKVNPVNDGIPEPATSPETVVLALDISNPNFTVSATEGSATVSIADAPLPEVSLNASDPNAAEWDPVAMMPDPGEFTISRTGDPTNSLTVTFSLSASTADLSTDYSLVDQSTGMPVNFNGTHYEALFNPAETTKILKVEPVNDLVPEPATSPETVVLDLDTTNANFTVSPTQGSATVEIADAPINVPPEVDTLVLADGTSAGGTTDDPTVSGTITHADGDVDSQSVEIDYNNDGFADASVTTNSAGEFEYDPSASISVGPVTIQARGAEYDSMSGAFIYGTWVSISFEYASSNVPPEVATLVLADGTPAGGTTDDPAVSGTITHADGGVDFQTVEIDYNNDGFADGSVTTDSFGAFEYDPSASISVGPVTIQARGMEYDSLSGTFLYGSWVSISFTYASFNVPPEVATLVLADGTPAGGTTDDPAVSGTITHADGGVDFQTVEIDYNNDGFADASVTTDSFGAFEYDPSTSISVGPVTIQARGMEYDSLSGTFLYGSWVSISFEYASFNVPPEVATLVLADGTPAGGTTDDPTVSGTITHADGGVDFQTVEIDYNNDGFADASVTTDSFGAFEYDPSASIGVGPVTIQARGMEYDSLSGTFIYGDWIAISFTYGTPLMAGGAANDDGSSSDVLQLDQLALIIAVASQYWIAANDDGSIEQTLGEVTFSIADLPGAILSVSGTNQIVIDINGAGHGWFIDATPEDNSEFLFKRKTGQFEARPHGPADGRMDLLTVVIHELGHLLGFEDRDPAEDPHDVMSATLEAGVRRLPTHADDPSRVSHPVTTIMGAGASRHFHGAELESLDEFFNSVVLRRDLVPF